MTRLPTQSQDIVAAEGPQFQVGPRCSVPGCTRYTDHAHHLVRRSFIGGDRAWVRMPDGVTIGNLAPLCFLHHQDVTDNKVQIVYEEGVFLWDTFVDDPVALTWQPPLLTTVHENPDHPDHDEPVPSALDPRPACPTCGQKLPKPKVETPQEEKKLRKTWAVAVPVEDLEDGADTLDALLEAARNELANAGMEYSASTKVKFHVLSASLGIFVQHAHTLLADG